MQYAIPISPMHATCDTPLFYNMWLSVQVMKLLIMQSSAASRSGPNILLSAPFSDILSPCSSHSVTYKVSHPYKTRSKIIVLYLLFFRVL